MSKDVKSLKNLTDEELILLVQKRDQEAFAELINRYTPRVWRVIHANSRQHQDAEEIQTDLWMAVWKNIRNLRNIESFGAWLHRIAYNACKRYYTIRRQSRNEIPHDATVITEQLNEHAAARFREYQLIADIREAVHHLPQKLRSVAKLFYLESWQINEIASEFNMPIGTVKTKLREIRTLLRKEFDAAPLTAQVRGETMKSESVQPKRIIEKTKNTVKPAIFNVDPNDATGDNWRLPDGVYAKFGKGEVKSTKLSPVGGHFAVGTTSGLWWYDVNTMRPISLWDNPQGCVFNIDFSPDGKLVILVTQHGTINVMDVASGECVLEIEEQNRYVGLACSSTGKWFATADNEGHIRVLDLHTGRHITQIDLGDNKYFSDLTFTPDGAGLASMVWNHKELSDETECLNPDDKLPQIYVWDPKTGKPLVKFSGDTFAISPDSRLIAGGSTDGTLRDDEMLYSDIAVWDISSSEQIAYFTEHDDEIRSIVFSPCGKYIASSDDILLVWEIATGSVQRVVPNLHEPFYVNNGQLYGIRDVTRPDGYGIDVWNVEANERVLEVRSGVGGYWFSIDLAKAYTDLLGDGVYESKHTKTADKIPYYEVVRERHFFFNAIAPVWIDDHTLVTDCWDGIVLLDVDNRSVKEHHFFNDYIADYVVMPSGEIIVLHCHNDHRTKVWRLRTHEKPITEIPVPEDLFERIRGPWFSPKGDRIACVCEKGDVYLWNIDDPENPSVLKGHKVEVHSVMFSPDGQRLISRDHDKNVLFWNLKTGQEIDRSSVGMCFFFSPCGGMIAAYLKTEIRILNAHTFTTLQTIPLPKPNCDGVTFAFTHCGQYLAGALWYQTEPDIVCIWEVETGKQVTVLHGQSDTVAFLAFSPNGKLLSGSCIDGTIVLWDVP